jgi:hypothetical protein
VFQQVQGSGKIEHAIGERKAQRVATHHAAPGTSQGRESGVQIQPHHAPAFERPQQIHDLVAVSAAYNQAAAVGSTLQQRL